MKNFIKTFFTGNENIFKLHIYLLSLWAMLQKLYCFDGEKQDGFEQESNLEIDESEINFQTRVFKEFEKRRTQSGMGSVNYEE